MREDSEEFSQVPLSSLVQKGRKITYGIVQPGQFVEDGVILVRGRDYSAGWRDLDGFKRVTPEIDAPYKRSKLRAGDLVITIVGANTGTVAVVPDWLEGANITQTTARVAIEPKKAEPGFVEQVLRSALGQREVYRYQKGGAQPGLNLADLEKFSIPLPPLPEQRKIAAILRTWDEALEKLNSLRTEKARWLDGLSQTTIGRGGIFPEHWQQKPLSKVCMPVKRKSSGGDHPVMTISAKSGFLMQADKFARDMAGRSVERYTLLHEGEFAYNKGNSKTAPYGCVFRLDRDTALVPFVYYCFALKPGLDPEFYDHLFSAGALNHQLSRLINSGVRNDGLLNLYSDDFFSCRVPVPPTEEQKRIAQALTEAKRELSLLDEEIAALTDQKRGLMQKLLTGEWRVEVSDDEEAAA
ncbi:restriction endonuclease subunit S [Rhodovulum marinum]|uniref:Type I restriction enzyme S subunit n=1 Tax=Rhodovulum marinum TaxID=320662 RepID=A0A4V2SQF2_9RHOB|nr:restriction endonuclease subunit S [Rhodovulum marinum]TCP38776.1 type I restriction enzyme S subunit [Rhodovulum marinum]